MPAVIFSVHVDVVPPANHPEPWSGRFDGTRVHGRGSADTKCNIVMLLEAMHAMQELGITPRANVLLDLVTDEEAGGNGALSALLHGVEAQEAVVLEPTSLRVYHGHRGCVGFEVVATSSAGHMGTAQGTSPIDDCLGVVQRLRELEARWLVEARDVPGFSDLERPLQLNLSGIHADAWHGSTPTECKLRASLGFLPSKSREEAQAEIAAAVLGASDADRLDLRWVGIRNEAFIGDANAGAATRLRRAAYEVGGIESQPQAWCVSCDARHYARLAGAETVVFGSGDLEQAHTDSESVEVDQVVLGAAVLVYYLSDMRSI
ncbi:M20 family metallopeptidase [Alkalilimnicola ehrlichii]|uniref:M20 family metallopeptidase n=1 Tax=Alkalilimnicola ehrlichii TaxID=351052 RepID=UPI0015F28B07|nr:M20/M25/M40 family metallo-hydrolase [Alkalilimnicola ehrlichii]